MERGRDFVGFDVVDELGGSRYAEGTPPPSPRVSCARDFVEGVEGVLPGLPFLVCLWISIPFQTIVGEGVGEEEGGRGEGCKAIVCDWQAGTFWPPPSS